MDADIRRFVLGFDQGFRPEAILLFATWPDLAAVYLNLRIILICVHPRLSLYSRSSAVRFFAFFCGYS
jgi:hypothetical protein